MRYDSGYKFHWVAGCSLATSLQFGASSGQKHQQGIQHASGLNLMRKLEEAGKYVSHQFGNPETADCFH